jgi:ABC-type Fe3+ transport system permease subunit
VTARALVAGRLPYPTARALLVGLLAAGAAAALVALVLWPLAAVVAGGAMLATAVHPIPELVRTLGLAAVSTALTVALATAVAYARRCAAPGGALAHRVLTLGLVLPPLVPALGVLTLAAGRRGFATLVAAQVVSFLPYAYLAAGHALAAVHPDREDAAESLGAGGLRILTCVTLPALVPGLATAAVAVALLCVADFVNPAIAGGGYVVLTRAIFASPSFLAPAVAAWLLAPCLLLAALGRGRARAIVAMPEARVRQYRRTSPVGAAPLTLVAVGMTLALLAACAAVVAAAAAATWTRGIAAMARAFGGPLAVSVTLAAAAGVAGTLLALLVAALVTRRAPGAALLEHASLLPSALPGLVLGLGLSIVYGSGAAAALCVAALTAAALPVAVAAALAAMRRLDPDLTTVAASLGVSRPRAFSRVVAPLLTPVAASILVAIAVRALGAVSVVAVLHAPGPGLAAVAALDVALAGRPNEACVPAVVLSVLVFGVVGLRRALPGCERASVWFL